MPNHGDKIKVWPMPGRRAQQSPAPVDRLGGGRFIDKAGEIVEWSTFHEEQLNHGTLLLHAPPCEGHEHGDRGDEACKHCGRTVAEAQKYDVHRATGIAAAKADADARALGYADHAQRVTTEEAFAAHAAELEAAGLELEAKKALELAATSSSPAPAAAVEEAPHPTELAAVPAPSPAAPVEDVPHPAELATAPAAAPLAVETSAPATTPADKQ